ncbi:MAG: alpha/beta hydrolase [Bradyrhizobium sp.]|uniref:alpha/beta fold hydrolase n=1 Tax=Bradyrhizobium sp. TaxID=376 RepID=UPI0025C3D8DE|nr:alpha/beta fold hydrolase [Bradyrhizobium sp.]MBI5260272.1 alpha/beta hydrolase [Bradyrhizobium sp.]
MDAYLSWLDHGNSARGSRESALAWTSPNTVALELSTMRLRDFSRNSSGRPVLICAPCALHRAQIADFAAGHSIVESLRQAGLDRIYVTDWRSASSDMRYLSIDSYLGDLNVAVDDLGSPVDLVGLCQGGWLSLVFAARFPEKVRRLVLVGAPVDLSIESTLSQVARSMPQAVLEQLVARGGGNVSGEEMLNLWSPSLSNVEIEATLQRPLLSAEALHGRELLERFRQWNEETLDLPGAYYRQVINWIFRENRIATGRFVALGRPIDLHELKTPVFLVVGRNDEVVPAEQALATSQLLGTPAPLMHTVIEPCNHLGLFMGAGTHAGSWRHIAGWLGSEPAGFRARTIPA